MYTKAAAYLTVLDPTEFSKCESIYE